MAEATIRADIMKLSGGQLAILIPFMLLKHFRKDLMAYEPGKVVEVFLYSFPNFAEGVLGLMFLVAVGVYLAGQLQWSGKRLPLIYLLAAILTALYTISQEFNLHTIGGENQYDPWDVLFSVLGILTGLFIVFYLRPGQFSLARAGEEQQ